jgi:hypothetical protein
MSKKKQPIDWHNHVITFISTIIGILIAFQLEDWRESREEQIKINKAELSLINELERNKVGLENIIKQNKHWLSYADFIFSHTYDDHLACTPQELDSISQAHPGRFVRSSFVKALDKTTNLYQMDFKVDVSFIFQIETATWEAVKSSGTLNYIEQGNVFWYVKTYKELERRLSTLDERELMEKLENYGSTITLYNLVVDQTRGYEIKLDFLHLGLTELEKIIVRTASEKQKENRTTHLRAGTAIPTLLFTPQQRQKENIPSTCTYFADAR